MTITYHDGFAIKPKRCDKCGRLFWLEFYDYERKNFAVGYYTEKCVCKKCLKEEDDNEQVH